VSPELGRDVGLLGALIVEALDTQGKPSVYWRLRYGGRAVRPAKTPAEVGHQVVDQVQATTRRAKKAAKAAAAVAQREAKVARGTATQQAKIARQAAQLKVVEVQRKVAEARA